MTRHLTAYIVVGLVSVAGSAAAQSLTRGPFVQNPAALTTTMTLSWWTNVAGDSTVEYGLTPALGLSKNVATAGSCEIGTTGTCHKVPLTGLQPGTRYYYRLLTNGVVVQPTTYFQTLQSADDPNPVVFTVLGDWGQGSSGYDDIAAQQNLDDPPLTITVGDNAYQNGTLSDWDNNALPAYEPLMQRALFVPVLGNHDLNSSGVSGWANSAEIRLFDLPRNAPLGQEERYFSFDSGNVHFVALESDIPLDATQTAWLQNDLATTTKRWKVVFLHHTPYSCSSGIFSIGSDYDVRFNWGPIFEEYGVDVVFDGHDHLYERSILVDDFLPGGFLGADGKGTYYVMTGGGGALLDGDANLSGGVPTRDGDPCYWLSQTCPAGPNGYCSFDRYQYSRVSLVDNTELTIEAVDRNGTVFDTFQIVKPSLCGNGVVDLAASEVCDTGALNGTASSCCLADCTLRSAGQTCRASAGQCDVAETCTGTTGACPANVFQPSSLECRPSGGDCDPAESCSGSAATCPSDTRSTSQCRASAGDCDPAESCDGSGVACPADVRRPNGYECRASAGVCDLAESCDGTSATCPADAKSTALCRGAAGACDVAESCDGIGNACPADVLVTGGTPCRAAAGVCDLVESCSGSSPACPADAKSSAPCRPSAGVCDPAESCTGAGNDCPADLKSTAPCRAAAGVCDVGEVCDGVGAACPADVMVGAGSECRASAGACDLAEACTGSSAACPSDVKSTAPCRASAGLCDPAEACDGAANDCPADVLLPAATPCRASGGVCDPAESCTGSSAACPSDVKSTAVCRGVAGPCDVAESCDGVGAACPPDLMVSAGTSCRAAVGVCDVAETCTGLGPGCPANVLAPAGTSCRASAGDCDVAETCTGFSASCPADGKSTAVCRGAAGLCDAVESCNGIANTCPPDQKSTGVCRGPAGLCDVAEVCDGVSNACPPDVLASAGTECRASAGLCDVAEQCAGGTAGCPADVFRPSGFSCRASTGACDIAESCTGTSGECPVDQAEPDGDGDGACDDADVCPTVSDPSQADGDGDGIGNACDPCTNVGNDGGPVFVQKAQLQLQKLGAPLGDERLKLKGTVTVPSTPAVDPVGKGMRIVVVDATGTTVLDAVLPPGPLDFLTRAGWTVNAAGTSWTYRDPGKAAPPVAGITKVSLKRGKLVGEYRFAVLGKDGAYVVDPGALPLRAAVVLDSPVAMSGQCGEAAFPGPTPAPSCGLTGGGAVVKCR